MKLGIFYSKVEAPEADLRWLAAHGFDAVTTGDEPALQAQARQQGLEPWACLGTFNPPSGAPELLCVDVGGNRQKWFGSGCPNNPEVRAASLDRYRRAASREQVEGVFCDGARFASPASGLDAFCTCFCDHCVQAADRLGLDFARMKRDVTGLHQALSSGDAPLASAVAGSALAVVGRFATAPGIVDWLAFRRAVITDFIGQISRVVRGQRKLFGGYFFSPCLSALVGQDYHALAEHVDLFAPMLYRNCSERGGIAPVNTEIHAIASWSRNCPDPAWVLELVGLPGERFSSTDELLTRGVSSEAVRVETARARALIGPAKSLAPIIWWDDPGIRDTMAAVRLGGADGVSIFLFHQRLKELLCAESA